MPLDVRRTGYKGVYVVSILKWLDFANKFIYFFVFWGSYQRSKNNMHGTHLPDCP